MPHVSDALAAIDSIGLPATTLVWPNLKAPPMPYAVLVPHGDAGQVADGRMHYRARSYDIELYARDYDQPLMQRLEGALDAAGILAKPGDIAIDEQNRFVIAYYSLTLRESEG